jgi:hypothetical protein
MDWGRFGVQMIPRFAMGSAMPSALMVFVSVSRAQISDPDHVELGDTDGAWNESLSTLHAQKRVFNSSENTGIEEKEIREQDVPYPKVIS